MRARESVFIVNRINKILKVSFASQKVTNKINYDY